MLSVTEIMLLRFKENKDHPYNFNLSEHSYSLSSSLMHRKYASAHLEKPND